MTQHTPGPWKHVGGWAVYTSNDRPLARAATEFCADVSEDEEWNRRSGIANQEAIANARLIAAAPELLEALRKVVNMRCIKLPVPGGEVICSYLDYTGVMDKALAAIAKAEGK